MRAILTYHSLDSSGSPISMPPEAFRRQLEWLRQEQVNVVRVDELLMLPAAADAAALTFDDGFANFATEAWPLLREFGHPATLFVVTGHVGKDNRWQGGSGDAGIPVLPLLDWDALARLREAGVTLAAHTRSHPRLTTIDVTEVKAELSGPVEEMERRLGVRPDGLAYPYGNVNARIAAVANGTYRWGCTTEFRPLGPGENPLLLPRLDAWYFRNPARLGRWGSPGFRAWIWGRRQGRRLRASLGAAVTR